MGFSPVRRSSAICRLDWDDNRIGWTIRRFRAVPAEMDETIASVAANRHVLAAGFDGPLAPGFGLIDRYRLADRMLTRRLGRKIGKPGPANVPTGRLLNAAANECARLVLCHANIAPATHGVAIDGKAIVEAFPSTYMGVLLRDPATVAATRSDRSDVFYAHLAANGALLDVLAHFLPGRTPEASFASVTNHDDRAALICALTALGIAANDFTAVGDADGWVILPPRRFVQDWARADIEANAREASGYVRHFGETQVGEEPRPPPNLGGLIWFVSVTAK